MTKMPKEGTFSSVVSQKVSQRSCNVLKNQCFKSYSRNSKKAQFRKKLSFLIFPDAAKLGNGGGAGRRTVDLCCFVGPWYTLCVANPVLAEQLIWILFVAFQRC